MLVIIYMRLDFAISKVCEFWGLKSVPIEDVQCSYTCVHTSCMYMHMQWGSFKLGVHPLIFHHLSRTKPSKRAYYKIQNNSILWLSTFSSLFQPSRWWGKTKYGADVESPGNQGEKGLSSSSSHPILCSFTLLFSHSYYLRAWNKLHSKQWLQICITLRLTLPWVPEVSRARFVAFWPKATWCRPMAD